VPSWPARPHPGTDAPNVIVILIDDMGFAQLGCYGSTMHTPHIDKLAEGGLRYTNFHVTPLCSPTRAALLTGRNHHEVGMRSLANFSPGFPNMRGSISNHAATIAEVLRDEGYATFAVGKWHLCQMEDASAAGTELARAHNKRGWWERVWFDDLGAGSSGCSAYIAKPRWQHDPHCPGRTVADVSAVATNIPIYNKDYGGWVTVEGTSVAAPLIAGIYGLAGNASKIPLGYAYSHQRDFFDVTRGTNSWFVPSRLACGNDYLCVAKKGYDAPTGLGTPDGIGAF
jgi:Sulfatase